MMGSSACVRLCLIGFLVSAAVAKSKQNQRHHSSKLYFTEQETNYLGLSAHPLNVQSEQRHSREASDSEGDATNDPCSRRYCGRGRECRVAPDGAARCVCQRHCKKHRKLVCGSDGNLYLNHCELHRAACLTGRNIAIDRSNVCLQKKDFESLLEKTNVPPMKPHTDHEDSHSSSLVVDQILNDGPVTPEIDDFSEPENIMGTGNPLQQESNRKRAKSFRNHHKRLRYQMADSEFTDATTTVDVGPGDDGVLEAPKAATQKGSPSSGAPGQSVTSSSPSTSAPFTSYPVAYQRYSKGPCTMQEYELWKDNLLLFSHAKLMDSEEDTSETDKQKGKDKEYLVSIMFSHYDQNNNGMLERDELTAVARTDHLDQLSSSCKLADLVTFDDADRDERININEFYTAFSKLYSVSLVSLDKALEVNHVIAHVGDNVEIKCDVTGSPMPPIVWRRNDVDLTTLVEDEIKVFMDGTLYLTHVQLVHAGNYTCHAQRNKDVMQTHVLHVETLPQVRITPKLQSLKQGGDATMECHANGVPMPSVEWLKNDENLKMGLHKYEITGNGTALTVKQVIYSDTGAYMCVATNTAGTVRDISSLVVQDDPTPATLPEEKRFFVFHNWGVSVYEPSACRLYHQIQGTDIIPGTQEYVCGDKGVNCSWGRAINVAGRYIYVSQPSKDRVLVISKMQMVVVDVVITDKYPVQLHYVPHLDQVWLLCWRTPYDKGTSTIQVIRDAVQKKKHHTVHPEPVDGHFDLVSNLFIPEVQDTGHKFRYGYAVHTNQRGMYKIDLAAMKYLRTVDLTPYNCVPNSVAFSSIGGVVVIQCIEPITGKPTGQIVLDAMTDSVLSHKPQLYGVPHVSPDSQHIVTIDHTNGSVTIVAQETTENDGLHFTFDVKTTLNISAVSFHPSKTRHSYDIYASAVDREDLLFVDLGDGKVEMITGVGRALPPQSTEWNNPNRPITSSGLFGAYLVTPADEAVFVVNGRTRTVNCEIGNLPRPRLVVWVTATL